jgi:hypothetical protein
MQIDQLPTPPQTGQDEEEFVQNADNLFAALPTFANQVNSVTQTITDNLPAISTINSNMEILNSVINNMSTIEYFVNTYSQVTQGFQESIEQIDNKLSDYATNTSLTEVQNDIKNLQLNSNNIEVMYSNVKLDKLVNLPDGIYIINIAGHAFSFEISSRCTFVYLNAPRATDDNTEDSTFVFTYKRTGQNSGGFTAHKHVIKWESGSVSTMSDSLTSYTCYSLIKIANL